MAELRPFAPGPGVDPFALDAQVQWGAEGLTLAYQLKGPLEQLVLEPAKEQPQRRDGLWQSTCFEAFIGLQGDPGYWELNLSSGGDWNLYRFEGYRSGGREEPRIVALPTTQRRGADRLDLTLHVPCRPWMATADPHLELSLTTVLEHRQMGCQYWALRHCGQEPDFHLRSSFIAIEALQ